MTDILASFVYRIQLCWKDETANISCLFRGSQEQSFFLQTLLFTACTPDLKPFLLSRASPSLALPGSLDHSGLLFGSPWLSLALSGSLWLRLQLPLALTASFSGNHWLSMALSGSHCLSWALFGSHRLTRHSLGSLSCSCVAALYQTLDTNMHLVPKRLVSNIQ